MKSPIGNYGADLLEAVALRIRTSENAVLLALSAALGLLTGLAVWVFQQAIAVFAEVTHQTQAALSPAVGALSIVITLALAGALVGWIMERFIGHERHHGVAGIMEAVALAGGRLRYRRMPFKAVASALSLGAGASVGPEDPSVQIGANLGSWFARMFRVHEDQARLLVAAGAAGAIAAAFRAPIAGVFFALEVILNGTFETRSFGVIVLASVVSSAVTQAIQPHAELGPFNYALGGVLEIALFIPLGLILAVVSVIFVRTVFWQHDLWHKHVHLPRPARTALAGAMVGVVGIFLPQIMGIGHETMSGVLSGELQLSVLMLMALAAFKILMTAVSMAGGFVGGIFAPSLFVGTLIGSLYAQVMSIFINRTDLGDPQAYAIVGMAATMAGVVRSPITAIIMVFELTNDYRLILPIMLAAVICVYLAERLEPHGLYTKSLIRQGVHLPQGRETDLMQGVLVGEVMLKPAPTIKDTASLSELRDEFRKNHLHALCVVNEAGMLSGIVTLSDLQRAYIPAQEQVLTVGEICTPQVITVAHDQWVWDAIRVMSEHDVGRVPVVKRGTQEVVGLLGRHGIVLAYNLAITRKLEDQQFAQQVRLNTLTGGSILEYIVTDESPSADKKIRDIRFPSDSAVAAVRRRGRLIVPRGDTTLRSGDAVTILTDSASASEVALLFLPEDKFP